MASGSQKQPAHESNRSQIEELVQQTAELAAERAVRKIFLTMGVDVSNPEHVIQMQRDVQHVRKWREATGAATRIGMCTVTTTIPAARSA